MKAQEYLKNRLENCSKYALTDEDQKILDNHGIEEYIFRKLASKKFRKWSLGETAEKKIKAKIATRISKKEPLHFNLSYGGFKLWRMPTAPEADWSEFFSIAYFSEYMAPIAAAYEPGTIFNFSSGDIAVTTANNIPQIDVDSYYASLEKLINMFNLHSVKNMHFKQSRLRDLFKDEQEFVEAGEKLRAEARKRFAEDEHYADEFRRGVIQNVQLKDGKEDLSKLSDEELNAYRSRSAEIVESMYGIPQIANREREDDIAIITTFLRLDMPMIITGTTRYSTAKFWAGMGVLAKNKDRFAEYVITPRQWEQIKEQKHEVLDVDFVPLKNFKKLLIYPDKFDFTR